MSVRRTHLVIVAALALAALPFRSDAQAATAAQSSPAEAQLAAELIDVAKVAATIVQGIEAGLAAQRAATPQLPKEFWDRFAKYAREGADSLAKSLIPVYTETFTEQELRELVAFYKSPVGRRVVETQPQVIQRSMAIGQKWGTDIGFRVAMEVQDPNKPPR